MGKKFIIIVLVLVVLVGGYLLIKGMDKSYNGEKIEVTTESKTNNQEIGQEVQPVVSVQVESDAIKTVTAHEIVYTDAGYAPSSVNIKVGDVVVFKNQSLGDSWVGSVMHPTHMAYSGTDLKTHCPDADNNDFDQCVSGAPKTSWSFTFTKAGSWGYHNHVNVKHFGKITVE